MTDSKMHPHLDSPTEEQLRAALEGRRPDLVDLYLEAHRLVLATLPEIRCSVDLKDGTCGYGSRQYGYDGWGLGALSPYTSWVSLYFMRGAHLADPTHILGGTGKVMRYVRLASLQDLESRREAIRVLLEAAAVRSFRQGME